MTVEKIYNDAIASFQNAGDKLKEKEGFITLPVFLIDLSLSHGFDVHDLFTHFYMAFLVFRYGNFKV